MNISDNKNFWDEKWMRIDFGSNEDNPHYEVSNYGRLRSYKSDPEHGKIIKGSVIQGYRSLNIRTSDRKTLNRYVHKLVAENFVPRQEGANFVIHLDFQKQNNHFENLKWMTKTEMNVHNRDNPALINRVVPKRTSNYKLTESKVRIIKRLLKNDNNRLKMIAKQFGITHTQLNRIRSGENWKHVTIDDDGHR